MDERLLNQALLERIRGGKQSLERRGLRDLNQMKRY